MCNLYSHTRNVDAIKRLFNDAELGFIVRATVEITLSRRWMMLTDEQREFSARVSAYIFLAKILFGTYYRIGRRQAESSGLVAETNKVARKFAEAVNKLEREGKKRLPGA